MNVRGLCGVSFMMAVLSHPFRGGGRGVERETMRERT